MKRVLWGAVLAVATLPVYSAVISVDSATGTQFNVASTFSLNLLGSGFSSSDGLATGELVLSFDPSVLKIGPIAFNPVWDQTFSTAITGPTTADLTFSEASLLAGPTGTFTIASIQFMGLTDATTSLNLFAPYISSTATPLNTPFTTDSFATLVAGTDFTLQSLVVQLGTGGNGLPGGCECNVVPEPSARWLMAAGLCGILGLRQRRLMVARKK